MQIQTWSFKTELLYNLSWTQRLRNQIEREKNILIQLIISKHSQGWGNRLGNTAITHC